MQKQLHLGLLFYFVTEQTVSHHCLKLTVIKYLKCQFVNCKPMAVYLQLRKSNLKNKIQ